METTFVNTNVNNETQKSIIQTDLEEAPQESETTVEACANNQDKLSCEPEAHHDSNEQLLPLVSHEPLKYSAYSYHQTSNNVTFILHVPVVKETTLVKSFEPQQVN